MDETSIDAMTPGVCEEVVLRRTRRAWEPIFRAALLVIFIAFVAMGVVMHNRQAWTIVLIATGILLVFTLRTRPATNTMRITRGGITYANMFFTIVLPWAEVQSVGVVAFRNQNGVVKKVVFTAVPDAPVHALRGFISLLTMGSELGLPSTYNLTPEDLVRLLTAWKDASSVVSPEK